MLPSVPRLCFVRECWAFFTTQPLEMQWGDDWDDAPYEHNAGLPYLPHAGESWEVIKVAWEGPFDTPAVMGNNCAYSVMHINDGRVPWLFQDAYTDKSDIPAIYAGISLRDFIGVVEAAGGVVYLARGSRQE